MKDPLNPLFFGLSLKELLFLLDKLPFMNQEVFHLDFLTILVDPSLGDLRLLLYLQKPVKLFFLALVVLPVMNSLYVLLDKVVRLSH
jgi:hypothetical protein